MKKIVITSIIVLSFYGFAKAGELVYRQNHFRLHRGTSIAVAPFQNLTQTENVGNSVADTVSNMMGSKGTFRIIGRNAFTQSMLSAGVGAGSTVDRSIAQKVGQLLGVNFVIIGAVTEYGYELAPDGTKTVPVAGVDIKIVDIGTGNIVFAGSFAEEDSSGTAIEKTVTEAVKDFYSRVR